jgi:hypothetical protein
MNEQIKIQLLRVRKKEDGKKKERVKEEDRRLKE